jgi:hypothetical protein
MSFTQKKKNFASIVMHSATDNGRNDYLIIRVRVFFSDFLLITTRLKTTFLETCRYHIFYQSFFVVVNFDFNSETLPIGIFCSVSFKLCTRQLGEAIRNDERSVAPVYPWR